MSTKNTDRITEKVLLRTPRARVWQALADSGEFGLWFGVQGLGAFTPGATVRGKITEKGYEHVTWEATIERMEPGRLLSFRWHPYAVDPGVDYSGEPHDPRRLHARGRPRRYAVLPSWRPASTGFRRRAARRRTRCTCRDGPGR